MKNKIKPKEIENMKEIIYGRVTIKAVYREQIEERRGLMLLLEVSTNSFWPARISCLVGVLWPISFNEARKV